MPPRLKTTQQNPPHLQVVRAAAGEPLCFETVYNQYFKYIAAIALRLLGNDTDVDDVVQEVFWDCSKKVDMLNDMEHARRWLIQVTVRKTRKLLRRRKLATMLRFSDSAPADPVMPSASADDRAAVIQLFRLLDAVPVNHRLAWTLRYVEGASLVEVAEACGGSLASVKRWIAATQAKVTGGGHG